MEQNTTETKKKLLTPEEGERWLKELEEEQRFKEQNKKDEELKREQWFKELESIQNKKDKEEFLLDKEISCASFLKEKWETLIYHFTYPFTNGEHEITIISDKVVYHETKHTWKYYLFHWVKCAAICVAICAASYWVSKAFTTNLMNIAITATFVILSLFIIYVWTSFLWADYKEQRKHLQWRQYLRENNMTEEEYFRKADEDFKKYIIENTEIKKEAV